MDLGFRNGSIELDEPRAVYYSGQPIIGKVNFKLHSPLSFLSLNVICKGEANVLWTEEEVETYNGVRRRREVKYVGHEVYFNFTQCLSGGNGISVLPPGTHSIPFNYQIPFTAPSSFKGKKGGVSYSVAAVLLLENGVTKEELGKAFEVIAPLDLNTEEIRRPIEMEFEEVYSCNCACAPRPLRLSVSAPHGGACPGQRVPLRVLARNQSSVEVTQIQFQLVRRMRYLSQQPMSAVVPPEDIVATMVKGPILCKTEREYNFEFEIPDFIALNLDNCGIIDVGYFFKVTVKVSGCNDDMTDEAEMCMGLVPIDSDKDVKLTHPMAHSLPNAPIPKQNIVPTINQPYNNAFFSPMQNVQSPPGPTNYPHPGNMADGNMYGSKSSLPGAFEKTLNVSMSSGRNSPTQYQFKLSVQSYSMHQYSTAPSAPPPS